MGMRIKKQQKHEVYRTKYNNATQKGHIHKHKPAWLPPTRMALTHAFYRRKGLVPPTRRIKER